MRKLAYLFVIISAILWGTIGVFGKTLSELGFNTFQIVATRAIGASVVLIAFILLKDYKLLKINIKHIGYFVGTGVFSFAFFNLCYFVAINRTSLSVAAILLYTAPTFVMIMSSVLFREKFVFKKVLSLILTFVGCILVTAFVQGNGGQLSLIGFLSGLGAGFGYALYSIFGRYALERYSAITVTTYTFIFASIGILPFTDIKGMYVLYSNTNTILYGIALAVICTVLPFLLYTKGLSYIESSKASIIATLEPVVATVIGIIIYSEPVTLFKVLGISLIVLAVIILRERS